jgi:tRNA pseudouridine38-40 synthase
MRYVLDISYHGARYAGWQIQANAHTVQAELEQALGTILRQKIATTGAGRTDAGVHARQLMVHFDFPDPLPERFHFGLNGILPPDVAVNQVFRPARPDFHTRFDALSRSYDYQLVLRKSPLLQGAALWVRQPLNFEAMNEAAACLPAYQDFASFCKAHGDNRTTLCELHHAFWEQTSPYTWAFHIKANRFLRGMVRAVVGSLLEVGKGNWTLADFRSMVEARDRRKAGPNVLPYGLYLAEVSYPEGSLVPC